MSNTRKPRRPAALDFDKIRGDRGRVRAEPRAIRIGGKLRTLAPTLPLSVTDYFAENAVTAENGDVQVLIEDMKQMLAELFGDDQWAEIRKLIDLADIPLLFEQVFKVYGEALGESSQPGES